MILSILRLFLLVLFVSSTLSAQSTAPETAYIFINTQASGTMARDPKVKTAQYEYKLLGTHRINTDETPHLATHFA